MSPPENLKRKVLTQDADGDGRTGVTLYTLSTILRIVWHKKKTALKRNVSKNSYALDYKSVL